MDVARSSMLIRATSLSTVRPNRTEYEEYHRIEKYQTFCIMPIDSVNVGWNSRRKTRLNRASQFRRGNTWHFSSRTVASCWRREPPVWPSAPPGPAEAQAPATLRFSAVFSEQDIRAEMMKRFGEEIKGARLHPAALLRRHAVQAGHRARRHAARQPRDGQHRAAGHLEPDPGLVDRHLGLSLPRRRPPEEGLRERCRPAAEEDGRPTSSASTSSARPISARAMSA